MSSNQIKQSVATERPLLVLSSTAKPTPSHRKVEGDFPPKSTGGKPRVWVEVDGMESPTSPRAEDTKETGDSKKDSLVGPTGTCFLRTALQAKGGRSRLAYFRTKMNYETGLQTPANTSYIWTFVTIGTTLVNTWLGSTVEWSAINSIFEEFFIHSMSVKFEPVNQYSNQRLTTTVTDLQSCALTIGGYQHNQGAGADAASLSSAIANSNQSLRASSARPWTFKWVNVEKFDRKGPAGDASTAQNSQGWLNNGSVAKVGGFVQIASYYAGQTAGDNTHLLAAKGVGTVMVTWDVSFRYRD